MKNRYYILIIIVIILLIQLSKLGGFIFYPENEVIISRENIGSGNENYEYSINYGRHINMLRDKGDVYIYDITNLNMGEKSPFNKEMFKFNGNKIQIKGIYQINLLFFVKLKYNVLLEIEKLNDNKLKIKSVTYLRK